ncbi:MAG: histidine phosphatase family protein [Clostridia bacterium]|nr:histidine phosphatase family protein [Clostridia bacterium]
MKLLIIRHGDPDYVNDTLTEVGRTEASLLADWLKDRTIDHVYVSPLGRARATAEYTCKIKGMDATICDWLREFPARVEKPHRDDGVAWDWRPADWTCFEEFFSRKDWHTVPAMEKAKVAELYQKVIEGFDALLAEHGYVREGNRYRVTKANTDTIALFCHFGLESVLLSHLLNISPMLLWHGTCAAPTSVTTVNTEERQKGIAYFRMSEFGSVAHLTSNGVEPSFSARFCETYDQMDQRHD